jgi:hypothetical protein
LLVVLALQLFNAIWLNAQNVDMNLKNLNFFCIFHTKNNPKIKPIILIKPEIRKGYSGDKE